MAIKIDTTDNFWMLRWLDEYMIGHKGFIAGGCFKNIFQKEKVKDLDIFFESEEDWYDAVEYFDSMTPEYEGDIENDEQYTFLYENPKVKAYKNIKSGIRVELCRATFGTPEQVLRQFDFSITKFAYYKIEVEDNTGAEVESEDEWLNELDAALDLFGSEDTHIEYKVAYEERFFEHLHLKRLVTDEEIPYPMSTFERMIRYIGYGYKPCRETKIKIAKAIHELTEEKIDADKSLYDGMD